MKDLKAPKRKKSGTAHTAAEENFIPATPYEWFGGRIKYALHGAIDDATGKVVGLFMTQNECLYGYLETLR